MSARGLHCGRIFYFLGLFKKVFYKYALELFFSNLDPYLDAIVDGAELICLGAKRLASRS